MPKVPVHEKISGDVVFVMMTLKEPDVIAFNYRNFSISYKE